VAKFEADNPDYKVTLEYIPGGDYPTKLISDLASGIKHDVILAQTTDGPQSIKAGSLGDITDYFSTWPKEDQDDFSWHPALEQFTKNNRLYALPLGLHTRTIAYRKDMFEAAGLDPNRPPQDLDEMVAYAKRLTHSDPSKPDGTVWGLGIYMGPHQASVEVVMNQLIWSLGSNSYDVNTEMATFMTPQVHEVIQWMFDAVYVHKITPTWTMEGLQDETLLRPFLNGQFAMCFGIGNYWLADVQKAGLISGVYPASANVDDSKVGWFVIPEKTGKTFINAWGIAMSSTANDKDAAWKLITVGTSKDVIKDFIGFGGFPARRSGYGTPEYNHPFWQKWLSIADTGQTLNTVNYNNVKVALMQAMQEIITGGDAGKIDEVLLRYQNDFNNRYGGAK
jgi:ABC-type glycerol-3-phosphate transport system substrate-binding protein